jgi:hypothetical protein
MEENIKMDINETGWGEDVEWTHRAQDRGQWRALDSIK